jgi:uncharacterized phosphosugar-binding protein
MSATSYLTAAVNGLTRLQATQTEAINRAADLLTEVVVAGGRLFSFGASHSFMLTEELVYRTGGLMLINPIYPQGMNLSVRPVTLTSQLERLPDLGRVLLEASPAQSGDALLIASTSGRNAVTIDMAVAAREREVRTVAITSLAYAAGVPSRHPSGKHLHELCDLVIDNCAPLGDCAVEIPGLPQKTGPLSTVLGGAAVNALAAQVIRNLADRGLTPPVFLSANLPGGDEHNRRLLEENRDRIFYL